MPAKKTFWERVEKTDSCWLWKGARRLGYGRLLIQGRTRSAHIVAYEEAYGPVPTGLKVMHRCDNPPCVRPDHLTIGTQAENVLDAVVKGRHKNPVMRGERHPLAKLSAIDVAEIRHRAAQGLTSTEIAKDFPITARSIRRVIAGHRWKGPEDAPIPVRGMKVGAE